jgi:hypothetical protein
VPATRNPNALLAPLHAQAIDSNDKSPTESHHLSAAFRILRNPECNFMHRMPQQQQQQLRKLMIELVLATDMAEHMAIVSRLKTDVLKRLEAPDDSFEINDEVGEPLKALILQAAIKVLSLRPALLTLGLTCTDYSLLPSNALPWCLRYGN